MSDEVRLVGAFALAFLVALGLTPVAIQVAIRTNFHDSPGGYKSHRQPTPYLGGAAVLLAFLVATTMFTSEWRLLPIAGAATALLVVGTLDDRLHLGVFSRIMTTLAAAGILWSTDLGWAVFESESLNLLLTLLWTLALVNAFNLMDNMDGAAGSVAVVAAVGAGTLALVEGDVLLASVGYALGGACAGFLPYNLAARAKIFLGDGGSMPVGLVVASIPMVALADPSIGWPLILAAVVLVGLPVLDMTLVVVSRRRRGMPLASGSTDHVTHRLRTLLPSARAVVIVLAAGQVVVSAAGILVAQMDRQTMIASSLSLFAAGALVIAVLDLGWAEPAYVQTDAATRAAGIESSDIEEQAAGELLPLRRRA